MKFKQGYLLCGIGLVFLLFVIYKNKNIANILKILSLKFNEERVKEINSKLVSLENSKVDDMTVKHNINNLKEQLKNLDNEIKKMSTMGSLDWANNYFG